MRKEQKTKLLWLITYLVILTWVILFKLGFSFSSLDHIRKINVIPFAGSVIANGKMNFTEIINNLIVFIPLGIYLIMLNPNCSFRRKVFLILGISLLYAVTQFIFAIGYWYYWFN